MKTIKGWVGTYAPSKGVYSFVFDTEKDKFIETSVYFETRDAKYLSYDYNRFVFPIQEEAAGICVLKDGQTYKAGKESCTACYVGQDKTYIYTVNYHEGTLIRYCFENHQLVEDKKVEIQEHSGAHQAILTKSHVYVPCRLLDHVYVYGRDTLEFKRVLSFPKHTGIRHGVASHDDHILYMVSEDSCEVFAIDLETNTILKKISLLKENEKGGGAAIRLSQNEKRLYISVREVNRVYVVDTQSFAILQVISSGGDHPRDINLSLDDRYLFVANRNSDNLVAFAIDENGLLEEKDTVDAIAQGVSIVCYE